MFPAMELPWAVTTLAWLNQSVPKLRSHSKKATEWQGLCMAAMQFVPMVVHLLNI
jgi:hypothetical protein